MWRTRNQSVVRSPWSVASAYYQGLRTTNYGPMKVRYTMRKKLGKWLLPLMAASLLVFAVFHVVRAQQTLPKPPPPVEPSRNPFGKTVAGAGIVEARSQNIAIGT